jgi:tetratricopeptide (TPR) repeat protein
MLAHHYLNALHLARAAHRDTADRAAPARTALERAGDRAFALNAFAAAAGFYRAALALWPQDAEEQRAGLLRLLGTVLYEAGELDQAEAVLAEGFEVAAAARLPAAQARIRIMLGEIRAMQGGSEDEALAECAAATAILEVEDDREGLAEAWLLAGKLLLWLGQSPAALEALERAMSYARQSGNHRADIQASSWLAGASCYLPIPVDAAIARAEQLLQIANGEPWAEADILMPLSLFYAYAGRFAEARGAIARVQSVYGGSAAKVKWAMGTATAGNIEWIAGEPAAAEHHLREAYEAFRAMGERGYLSSVAGSLAEALYAQGRLDEAQQMTEEAQAAATPSDIDTQARWRSARAKVLARSGQFPAALTLLDEAEALVSPTSWATLQAEIPMARAEVDRLAGAAAQAEASLRAALRTYQDRHATPLADQAAAALASLTDDSAKPA